MSDLTRFGIQPKWLDFFPANTRDRAGRAFVVQWWLRNLPALKEAYPSEVIADLIVASSVDEEIAVAAAACILHESKCAPVCFFGSRASVGTPGSKWELGATALGIGQVTKTAFDHWYTRGAASPKGKYSYLGHFPFTHASLVIPPVSVLMIVTHLEYLRTKYKTIEVALKRYAGTPLSVEEYAKRPSSLIAYMKLAYPLAVGRHWRKKNVSI